MIKYSVLLIITFFYFTAKAQLMEFTTGANVYWEKGKIIKSYDPGSQAGTVYYQEDVDNLGLVPTVGLFYYRPIFSDSNKLSAGIQSGLDIFAFYNTGRKIQNQSGQTVGQEQGYALLAGFNLPILLMGRIGSLSMEGAKRGFGAAIGTGITLMGFQIPDDKGIMLPLSACIHLNYRSVGLRFDMPLKQYQSYYNSTTGKIPRLSTAFYRLQLMFSI